MRNFRNYDIWLEAVAFADSIYAATENFPKYEIFSLANQMQRAAVSISSNIAEGCSRDSAKDFAHFLELAIGSAFEVETQLLISQHRQYISEEQYQKMIASLDLIEKQIHQLIKVVRGQSPSQSQR